MNHTFFMREDGSYRNEEGDKIALLRAENEAQVSLIHRIGIALFGVGFNKDGEDLITGIAELTRQRDALRLQVEDLARPIIEEARKAVSDEAWDQHAVQCGNCSVRLISNGGKINVGLSDTGASEDEGLCGRCAGSEMYRLIEDVDSLTASVEAAERDLAAYRVVTKSGASNMGKALSDSIDNEERLERQVAAMREAIEKADHGNGCATKRPVCADCGRMAGNLAACHGMGEVVNGVMLRSSQHSAHIFPHPCNCWKSRALALLQPAPAEADKPEVA